MLHWILKLAPEGFAAIKSLKMNGLAEIQLPFDPTNYIIPYLCDSKA